MRMEYIIDKDTGEIKATVLDRQGENCQTAVQQAQGFGSITHDERTGPDCDEAYEVSSDKGTDY